MITKLRSVLVLLLFAGVETTLAQAPNISYPSPQVYIAGTAISSLSPTNTGGAVPAATPVALTGTYNNITGVAVDASGNVYVAENGNSDIKEIPAGGGSVLTLGSGLNHPTGVAVDAAGNVFVTDNLNNVIKEIPAGNGTVVTIATGFNGPYGIALDGHGFMYVGDASNNQVKKIPVGGGTAVVIGIGFNHPTGVAVDAAGNVFVANRGGNVVQEILASNGSTVTLSGGAGNPNGVAVDAAGNVYFADTNLNYITEIPVGGGSNVVVGSGFLNATSVAVDAKGDIFIGDNGNSVVKEIAAGGYSVSPSLPAGLSMDKHTGIISGTPAAAAAASNYTVTATNSSGSGTATINITVNLPAKPAISYATPQVYTVPQSITPLSPNSTGGPIPSTGAFSINPVLPAGLSFDINTGIISGTPTGASAATNYTVTATNAGGSGTAVVRITVNFPAKPAISYNTPQVYTATEAITPLSPSSTGGPIPSTGAFSISPAPPVGLSFDVNTGILSGTPSTQSASANYTVTATNSGGSGTAIINITVDPYPAPSLSYSSPQSYPVGFAITPLSPSAANVGTPGSSTIVVLGSGFINFTGIAVDATGNVYIAENGNNDVREIPANGGPTLTLGSGFINPTGVAVDGSGNVFVVDNGNNAVKKIPAGNGAVVTIANGFNGPYGIALDASGNIYVGDANNNEVKKIPSGGGTAVVIGSGFNHPTGVAVDASGNVYVADRANNQIKKILAGNGSTIALGNGFGNPNGVAVDQAGNVYFADTNSGYIVEIPANGGSYIQIGANFSAESAVAVGIADSNVIYVASTGNGQAEKVGPAGGYFISPALPAGLAMASATGVISGTPTAVSPATDYTVKAYNIGGSGSAVVNIAVYNTNAGLANLTLSAGTLSPVFATAVNSYSVTEQNSTSSITITPTTSLASSTVTVNGTAVVSGTASPAISLNVGPNPISVIVKSSGGQVIGNYTITANRSPSSNDNLAGLSISTGTLTPAFSTAVTSYSVGLSAAVTSISVTPTVADLTATVTVNNQVVASGNASQPIPLSAGNNTIPVTVTAQDGTTIQTYTITVVRSGNAKLSNLTVSKGALSPAFSSGVTSYSDAVGNSISSITVTPATSDAGATITVNGVAVASGTPSGSIPLNFGSNVVSVIVTAADETTDTYTVNVNRALGTNANLTALGPSNGQLTPAFAGGTTSYTTSVNNAIASMTLKPVAGDANATITVNGIAVASGTVSSPVMLNEGGATVITTVVTSQDGVTQKTYTLTVNRAPSANANLSNISLSNGTLNPTFAGGTTAYSVSEATSVSSITLTPTAADANATIKVNGTTVASGAASGAISLSLGANTITVMTMAQDGTTTKTYTLTVTRSSSPDASLSKLKLNGGTLSPAFAPATTSYSANVANNIGSVTVTPTSTDPSASITVNGTAVASGATSGAIALNVGANTISTVIIASDGTTTKTYTITVTRAASSNANLISMGPSITPISPAFSSATTSYTISAGNAATAITVKPVAGDANATIKVNGTAVTSGTVSQPIALSEGATTNISVVVTAQDVVTIKTYTIAVTRTPSADATLSNISLNNGTLSPVFTGGTTGYTASVANSVSSITLTPTSTDANATIKVNGTVVATGTASGAIALTPGPNTITTVVTAQNGSTTKTYTLTVNRAFSPDASLSGIQLSAGTLSPTFATGIINYTAGVTNTTTSITLTPTTTNSNATVKVNGTPVTSGTASGPIALNVGQNTITVLVTAQDGTTTGTYTVAVTRAVSANANLTSINPSATPLSPAFAPATTSYTLNVANAVSTMTVRPVTNDANATLTVNGTATPSGTTSGPIALAVGSNTINIIVTAQNGTTTKTYTITVTRASGSGDSFDPGISVTKPAETPSLEDDVILVHQGISPNGDGVNDFLLIDGIQAYPDNKLSIMNRNGQLVYEAKGYDNSSKTFDGHSNKNGQLQLPGTYFYQLDYTVNNVTKHKTGFIVLKY